MGEIRFDSREYLLVRIETDAGASGLGVGMTRGAPVAEIVERNLAPLLVGRDPLMIEQLWHRLYDRNLTIAGQGIFMRALCAVDIALWDIKGHAGRPADLGPPWRRSRAGASVGRRGVCRDRHDRRRPGAGRWMTTSSGARAIKIAPGTWPGRTASDPAPRRRGRRRAALSYDAHWAWRDAVRRRAHGPRRVGLRLASSRTRLRPSCGLAPQLRAEVPISLALGEDAVGRWAFVALLAEL